MNIFNGKLSWDQLTAIFVILLWTKKQESLPVLRIRRFFLPLESEIRIRDELPFWLAPETIRSMEKVTSFYFSSLFLCRIRKTIFRIRIRDLGIRDTEWNILGSGSGISIPDTQHWFVYLNIPPPSQKRNEILKKKKKWRKIILFSFIHVVKRNKIT
jgi:hypothetical protein